MTFCEPRMSARNETTARIQAETGAVLIHPYDDDRIIAGQATAAKELLEEVGPLDAVLSPVSGGGLLSGTVLSAKERDFVRAPMRQTLEFLGKNEKSWCKNSYLRAVTGLVTRRKIRSPLDDTAPAIPWSGLRIRFAVHTFDELFRRS